MLSYANRYLMRKGSVTLSELREHLRSRFNPELVLQSEQDLVIEMRVAKAIRDCKIGGAETAGKALLLCSTATFAPAASAASAAPAASESRAPAPAVVASSAPKKKRKSEVEKLVALSKEPVKKKLRSRSVIVKS